MTADSTYMKKQNKKKTKKKHDYKWNVTHNRVSLLAHVFLTISGRFCVKLIFSTCQIIRLSDARPREHVDSGSGGGRHIGIRGRPQPSEKVLGEIYARTFELGLHLVILHRCYVPFCDHVWTWTGWNSGRTKPRKKGNDMILSYPRSKIATDPNCSFMLIRLFIKMPKRMRTGWVWNSGANCNGRLAVNCQAIAKGSDMRWFVYLCIIFPVKDWHRKKKTLLWINESGKLWGTSVVDVSAWIQNLEQQLLCVKWIRAN